MPSPIKNFKKPFGLPGFKLNRFYNLGPFKNGLGHIILYSKEPMDNENIYIDYENPLILSNDCKQYILLSANVIIGSLFETLLSKTYIQPYMLAVGDFCKIDHIDPFYGSEKNGVLIYKGEKTVIIIPSNISIPLLIEDKK